MSSREESARSASMRSRGACRTERPAERLAFVGGELEHGTNSAGDFVLRATVPGRA